MGLRSAPAVLAVTLILSAPGATGQPSTGAGCATPSAVEVKDNVYSFKYDSFVVEAADKGRYHFTRCIVASEPKKLWVHWENTGVKGWTNRDGVIQGSLDWPSKEDEAKKTVLWYGGAPKKTNSTYRDVKEVAQAVSGGTVRSFAKLGLAPEPKTPEEAANAMPIDVSFQFESSAIHLPNKTILYTFSWRDELTKASDVKLPVYLSWDDRDFVSYAFRMGSPGGDMRMHFQLGGVAKGGSYTDRPIGPPVAKRSVIKFTDAEGRELGSTAVTVLQPVKW